MIPISQIAKTHKRSERGMVLRTLIAPAMACCIAILAAAVAAPARAEEPVRIRQAYAIPVIHWASILSAKPGLARHFGHSYVMEPIRFKGSPQALTALAADEIEVGLLAYSTLAFAIDHAGMKDLRIIAGEFEDGFQDYYSAQFFVLKNGPIQTVDDLKGKVIATNGAGSAIDIAIRAMLRLHNLDPKKDVAFVEAAIPNMFPMLTSRKVDLIYGARTLAADPAAQQSARVLFTQKDSMGTVQMNVWAVRQGFIDKHRPALVDYMEDALRAERWFLDPANRQEVVAIAAKIGKAPAAYFDSWLYTKKDQYHNPDMQVDVDALQRSLTLMTDLGYVKASIDVRNYLDKSIVGEAAARLR